jgi:hypothetical protein
LACVWSAARSPSSWTVPFSESRGKVAYLAGQAIERQRIGVNVGVHEDLAAID